MKLRIQVEGKSYDVEVEVLTEDAASSPVLAPQPVAANHVAPAAPARPVAVAPPPRAAAGAVDASRILRAPIIGTVTQVKVNPGDVVAADDVVVVMEAMKMETKVATAFGAKVKTVCVRAGEAVKAGQVLVEFE